MNTTWGSVARAAAKEHRIQNTVSIPLHVGTREAKAKAAYLMQTASMVQAMAAWRLASAT